MLIRLPVAQIRSIGRATQGVKLIKLGEGTLRFRAITRIITAENNENEIVEPQRVNHESNSPEPEEG